ncbi:hypothetical protein I7I48_05996 [Histoplasma ohiense]|nr:hypothetical protein I7I48_05996 [Histoplasma ohiense (nom. inval.)]
MPLSTGFCHGSGGHGRLSLLVPAPLCGTFSSCPLVGSNVCFHSRLHISGERGVLVQVAPPNLQFCGH